MRVLDRAAVLARVLVFLNQHAKMLGEHLQSSWLVPELYLADLANLVAILATAIEFLKHFERGESGGLVVVKLVRKFERAVTAIEAADV